MGFYFTGFFARASAELASEAERRWPACHGRIVSEPFSGILLACPDANHCETVEEVDRAREVQFAVEQELPAWSVQYPEVTFVFAEAVCVGGVCFYQGFVCQNGNVLAREPARRRGEGALARLLAHLGVELDEREDFVPFRREFWRR